MSDPAAPAATLLFDDDCASCWRLIGWLHRRGALDRLQVAPWQWVAAERLPLDRGRLGREIVYVAGAEVLAGARALVASLSAGGSRGWRLLGRLLRLPVLAWAAAVAYQLAVAARHPPASAAPTPAETTPAVPTPAETAPAETAPTPPETAPTPADPARPVGRPRRRHRRSIG